MADLEFFSFVSCVASAFVTLGLQAESAYFISARQPHALLLTCAPQADMVFFTVDNPGTEEPDRILSDMISGLPTELLQAA